MLSSYRLLSIVLSSNITKRSYIFRTVRRKEKSKEKILTEYLGTAGLLKVY